MRQFVIPYIMYKDAKKAADYYETVFGGYTRYVMLGKDMPDCPEDQLDRVMHLEYVVDHNLFYMADAVHKDDGRVQLHLNYDNKEKMEKAFNAMKPDGTVLQELKTEFWGAVFGVIKDQFDVTWQFHYKPKTE